ncbi:MAG: hypothetical protein LBH32_05120 [Dysgonamonadaceae bacterium]|jgi:hypothetical protein|nr:hypothetical protein [Dysgonamonadaceae bacterium]
MLDVIWQFFEERHLSGKISNKDVQILVFQDENYNLNIEFSVNKTSQAVDIFSPDEFFSLFTDGRNKVSAKASKNFNTEFTIKNIMLKERECDENKSVKYSGIFSEFNEIRSIVRDGEISFVVYWFLNASERLGYSEIMQSSKERKISIQWGCFDKDEFDLPFLEKSSLNCIKLKYQDYDFLFGRVDDENDLKRSFIRFGRGMFPPEEIINDLMILLSYILGTELIYIGFTKFNKNSYPIEKTTYSTYRKDITNILSCIEMPPAPIRLEDKYLGMDPVEQINVFFNNYIEKKSKYNFRQIFWYIIYARTQSYLTKLQPLATAFDLVCQYCFKEKNNILSTSEFSVIITEIEKIIDNKNIPIEIKKQLMSRFHSCNYLSGNKKNVIIFEKLRMDINNNEKEALKARNTSIHGKSGHIDITKIIINNNFFMTLLNRLILKIFGITHYIDYSKQGVEISKVEQCQSGMYKTSIL